eukprot:COSAG04_NODE_29_length_36122_cov_73.422619_23_plen_96_part_00
MRTVQLLREGHEQDFDARDVKFSPVRARALAALVDRCDADRLHEHLRLYEHAAQPAAAEDEAKTAAPRHHPGSAKTVGAVLHGADLTYCLIVILR